jgi:hypothetical protein
MACPKGIRTPSVGQAEIVGGNGDSATASLVKFIRPHMRYREKS